MSSLNSMKQFRLTLATFSLALITSHTAIGQESVNPSHGESLGIAELVHRVQQELIESQKLRESRNIPPLFKTKELELELNFVVRKSGNATIGFDLVVVSADGAGTYTTENVQRIRLLFEAGEWEPQNEATETSTTADSITNIPQTSTGGGGHMPTGINPGPDQGIGIGGGFGSPGMYFGSSTIR